MKNYRSKFERAKDWVERNYPSPQFNDKHRHNVFRQYFASMIVGTGTTIGRRGDGKFELTKPDGRVLKQI